MVLNYFPRAGEVLVCDFRGFKIPEIVKPRPVIMVSPRLPYRSEIAAIVPVRGRLIGLPASGCKMIICVVTVPTHSAFLQCLSLSI